jgi:hypothetical protein
LGATLGTVGLWIGLEQLAMVLFEIWYSYSFTVTTTLFGDQMKSDEYPSFNFKYPPVTRISRFGRRFRRQGVGFHQMNLNRSGPTAHWRFGRSQWLIGTHPE